MSAIILDVLLRGSEGRLGEHSEGFGVGLLGSSLVAALHLREGDVIVGVAGCFAGSGQHVLDEAAIGELLNDLDVGEGKVEQDLFVPAGWAIGTEAVATGSLVAGVNGSESGGRNITFFQIVNIAEELVELRDEDGGSGLEVLLRDSSGVYIKIVHEIASSTSKYGLLPTTEDEGTGQSDGNELVF